ncbi:MAG: hypothetical protein AAFX87_05390 [Bacteroidota bacterium]
MTTASVHTNPFPGLRAFEMEEEHLFFGREKQVDELLRKLRTTRFLAVLGASGSGKSSLVKCGLLPALYSGFMVSAGSRWHLAQFKPGNDPIYNLASSLAGVDGLYEGGLNEKVQTTIVESTLRRSNLGLVETIRQSSIGERENILILVDQFEELFRFNRDAKKGGADAMSFVNLLLTANSQTDLPIYIALTMRSDFLGDCTQFKGLPEVINEGQYLVPRMTRDEQKMAISGPIAVGGAKISQPLLTRLSNDMGNNPDQLPILQHALMRTWDYWLEQRKDDEPIDIHHYEAIGTMSQALSRHADEAYYELDNSQQKVCEKVFKALTEMGAGNRGIRRPTKLNELVEITAASQNAVERVIEVFRKPGRSFLMPVTGTLSDETTVDISHESLMRIWSRLIAWTKEEQQNAETYLRVAEAASLYAQNKSGFYRNPELEFALRWKKNNRPSLKWAERYNPAYAQAMEFLKLSEQEQQNELLKTERQRKQRTRLIISTAVLMGVAAIVCVFLMLDSIKNARKADRNARIANDRADSLDRQQATIDSQQKKLKDNYDSIARQAVAIRKEKEQADSLRRVAEVNERKASLLAIDLQSEKEKLEENRDSLDNALNIADIAFQAADQAKKTAIDEKDRADKLREIASAQTLSSKSILFSNDHKHGLARTFADSAYRIFKRYKPASLERIQNTLNYDALLKVWDTTQNDQSAYPSEYDIKSISANPFNGNQFAVGESSGIVRLIEKTSDTSTYKVGKSFSISENINEVYYINKEEVLIRTLSGRLWRYDVKLGQQKLIWPKPQAVNAPQLPIDVMAVSDGVQGSKSIVSIASKDSILVFKYDSAELVFLDAISRKLNNATNGKVRLMEFNQGGDNTYLATLTDRNVIGLWRINAAAENGESVFTLDRFSRQRRASAMAINPCGDMVALGIQNKVVVVDVNSPNKADTTFTGHTSVIRDLAFNRSSCNTQLASASMDNTVRLWPIYAWKNKVRGTVRYWEEEPLIISQGRHWVNSVHFTPDDNWIMVGAVEGFLKIWPTNVEFLADRLKLKDD